MQQSKGESLIRCDVLNPYAELDLNQMDKGVRERYVEMTFWIWLCENPLYVRSWVSCSPRPFLPLADLSGARSTMLEGEGRFAVARQAGECDLDCHRPERASECST